MCALSIKVYQAGKAVKAGIPSQYAASMFAPSVYGQPVYIGGPSPPVPMLPMPQGVGAPPSNGYGREFDTASSGGLHLKSRKQGFFFFYVNSLVKIETTQIVLTVY